MSKRFNLDEKLILIFLLIVFSYSITVPAIHFINNISVKIFFFLLVLVLNFSLFEILNRRIKLPDFLEFIFILTVSSFAISCFYINLENNSNFDSIVSISTYIINFFLFFILLGKKFRSNNEKFDKFTNLILYTAIFLSLVSVVYLILGIHYIPLYSHTSAGLFGHPNTASMFYTICIPILFYKFFSGKITLPVFLSILFLFLLVLLFTFSRAGYIGVGVGILIYTFYKSRALFILVGLIVLLVATTIVLDFATSKVDSSASRFLLMLSAISVITASDSSFYWGNGPVNGVHIFIQEKIFFGNEPVPNPHNLLLMLSIQFGVIFTVLTSISVLVLLIKGMLLKFKNENFKNDQRLSMCMTIIISLIIQNFFEDVVVNVLYYVMPMFFFFSGYVYYSLKFKDQLKAEEA
jgi:O-antigen ligase